MSTRGLALHRQIATRQSSAAEQEQQVFDSTSISSPQELVPGSPLEQPAQQSDIFRMANRGYERLRVSPHGPALPSTTVAASTVCKLVPRADQSSIIGASELDAPLNVAGVQSVEEMRVSIAAVEATRDYTEPHSPDARTLSYPPLSSRGHGPLHSRPSLGSARPRGSVASGGCIASLEDLGSVGNGLLMYMMAPQHLVAKP